MATLTLTQTPDGVQFVLDPNESSPGFLANAADGFIESLDYVYSGPTLTSASFRNDDGDIDGFRFLSNQHNMDVEYVANSSHIRVDFPSRNDPGRFNPDQTRVWTVLGATLAQFTDTSATANSMPRPIAGVLSVTAYSLVDETPTPSNWVHAIPEPGASALLSMGVLALGLRRRSGSVAIRNDERSPSGARDELARG